MKNLMKNAKAKISNMCINTYCNTKNFINKNGNLCLFIMGVVLLTVGLTSVSYAQGVPGIIISSSGWNYRMMMVICRVFEWLEGGFGALIMIAAGLLAIVTAAMGAYKAAMSCLIIAVGVFILRAFATLFFPTVMDNASCADFLN
ncbi:MAG: hypothetical protein LBE20_05455 [Deltaproteobacteria bacterium]|jgi:hypothetical protein|nr:hypothetical protein [Deltaproteobacteria bacterium]